MDITVFIREVHRQIDDQLNEKTRRLLMAAEANAIGRGGISLVAKANKASRVTIKNGKEELAGHAVVGPTRVRRDGGGRKKMIDQAQVLRMRLSELLNPHHLTDNQSVLQWTDKSLRHLSIDLRKTGSSVSHVTLGRILEEAGFSLHANRKTVEKMPADDRTAQFEQINHLAGRFLQLGYPVIALNLRSCCHEKMSLGDPEIIQSPEAAKVEVKHNLNVLTDTDGSKEMEGTVARNEWESMGIFRETAAFAAGSIKSWWINMGSKKFAGAKKILIIADGGGCDGAKSRAWRTELKKLGQFFQMEIHVCHFPPGTTKWRAIEHFLLSKLTKYWNHKRIESIEVSVNLISAKIEAPVPKFKNPSTKSVNNLTRKPARSNNKTSGFTARDTASRWNYIITQNIE